MGQTTDNFKPTNNIEIQQATKLNISSIDLQNIIQR